MSSPDDSADLHDRLRALPAVDTVLRQAWALALCEAHGRSAVTRAVQTSLDRAREAARAGAEAPVVDEPAVRRALLEGATLRRVLNATGVIVHTNLGRAPLAPTAALAARDLASGYVSIEYDLQRGARGHRHDHPQQLLAELTGAEAAVVVNNNAAAVLLGLLAVGSGRDVIVSRGELVEIGGGFRVPDVMAQSGCVLVEVGTTNRTHLRDYTGAMGERTGALLKIHRSNFEVVGFTSEVSVRELAVAAKPTGVPVLVDAGSGCLLPVPGARDEPTVGQLLAAGADLVMFSGDKLLGGPQCGIVAGRRDLVGAMRKHPLMRTLRPDKLCLAALVETLRLWRDDPEAVPVRRMVVEPLDVVVSRAEHLAAALRAQSPTLELTIVETEAPVGGGTAPSVVVPSRAVALEVDNVRAVSDALRARAPAVVGRVVEDRLLLDVKTLTDADLTEVAAAVSEVLR